MVAIRAEELGNNLEKVVDMVIGGERVSFDAKNNRSIFLVSDENMEQLERAFRNQEYLAMLDRSAASEFGYVFTMEELESMDDMTNEEVWAFAEKRKQRRVQK